MPDRNAVIRDVLAGTRWRGWQQGPVIGDASARTYRRLTRAADSVIVMDAPPDLCRDTGQFIAIAELLNDAGLAAPEVLFADLSKGVLVLSDLGTSDFASHLLRQPDDEETLYAAATDLLDRVARIKPPNDLIRLTPQVGAEMIGVLNPHYLRADITGLQTALQQALSENAPVADTLALRDYHAENLIWRPDRSGDARVGLLDFQDAFVAPAGYDLASLLRDARRDVPDALVTKMCARFAGQRDGRDLSLQIATLGVQRNLRILGIFAKLARVDGKTRYLQFMERLWRHILNDLSAPGLSSLRTAVLQTLPPPTPDYLRKIMS